LGSEPSKTEEKHLLPNPEFSSVLSGDLEIRDLFYFFVPDFFYKYLVELSVISRQRKDS
jgi:hypothetical protein